MQWCSPLFITSATTEWPQDEVRADDTWERSPHRKLSGDADADKKGGGDRHYSQSRDRMTQGRGEHWWFQHDDGKDDSWMR